jgi:hybrid cluster-associated redox disulfide protein
MEENKLYKVTKYMTVSEVLAKDKNSSQVFINNGLNCIEYPVSENESIENASIKYEVDVNKLVEDLNNYFLILK